MRVIQRYRIELGIVAANIALLMLLLPQGAMGFDDWGYLTSPTVPNSLMYTRLYDTMFHMIVKAAPWLFPWLNHVVIVIGHTISAVMFYLIASSRLGIKKALSFVFAVVFTFYAGTFSSVANTDTLNNVLPLMFTVLGIYLYGRVDSDAKKITVFISMSILAIFGKESGVAALALIPAFFITDMLRGTKDIRYSKKLFFSLCVAGFIILCVYVTFFYFTQIRTGAFGFVKDESSPGAHYLIAFLNNTLNAYTPATNLLNVQYAILGYDINVPAWEFALVAATLFCGIFTVITGFLACKEKSIALVLFALGIIAIIPYIPRGAPSEMYSYMASWFALLLIAYLCNNMNKRLLAVCLGLFIAANVFSWSWRYIITTESTRIGKQITAYFIEQLEDKNIPNNPRLLYYALNSDRRKVDWYSFSPSYYHLNGVVLNSALGWNAEINSVYLFNETGYWSIDQLMQNVEYHYDLSDADLLQYAKDKITISREQGMHDIAVILMGDGTLYVY